MEAYAKQLKDIIGGLTGILVAAIGLFVIVRVVFGSGAVENFDVIANISELVNIFVGDGASLAGLVTLIIILSVVGRK
jgi:hypothetical protein